MRASLLLSAVVLACLFTPHSIAAQTTEDSTSWILSTGTDPFNLDLKTRDPGVDATLFGTLGRQWQRANSGVGLRIQLDVVVALPRGYILRDGWNCGGCELRQNKRIAGATIAPTYEWRRGHKIRPYILAGPGIFVERFATSIDTGVYPPPFLPVDRTVWSAGMIGAMGMELKWGNHTLFIEEGILAPQALSNLRDFGPISFPLKLGVKF